MKVPMTRGGLISGWSISARPRRAARRAAKRAARAAISASGGLAKVLALLVLFLASGLASCTVAETSSTGASPDSEVPLPPVGLPSLRLPGQTTAIDSLSAERAEEKVSVSGSVTKRVATLDGWLYQLQDATGSLWVVTNQSDPAVGEIATVSGTVKYEAIVVDEIDAGEVYLQEQSYRAGN
ncbi:MAG: hypothetical protein AAF716_10060 [Cyanobacteria bacterium P01_D01_bin.1]